MPNYDFKINKLIRLSFVIFLFAALGSNPSVDVRAQRAAESSIGVITVLTRPTTDGTTVTLFADTPLTRTQTWKDSEGFHIVLPDAWQSRVKKAPRGVEINQVGRSLEILVRTRPQATVRMQPLFNRLTLFVSGELDTSRKHTFARSPIQEPCRPAADGPAFNVQLPCDELERLAPEALAPTRTPPSPQAEQTANAPSTAAAVTVPPVADTVVTPPIDTSARYYPAPNFGALIGEAAQGSGEAAASNRPGAPGRTSSTAVPTIAYDDESDLPQAKVTIRTPEGGGFFSAVFSPGGAVALLGSGMSLLIFLRRRSLTRNQGVETKDTAAENGAKSGGADHKAGDGARDLNRPAVRRLTNLTQSNQPLTLRTDALELTLDGPQFTPDAPSTAAAASRFGVDEIKREVSMLVKGRPYRSDVLSSRALGDRRVVEASLVEASNASDRNAGERARARRALEDYGFVLRRGAALLSAPEVAVRASAARTLAEMKSPTSVPFLLEALYDTEAAVRTEVMSSIGAMKVPSAIGALLEVAFLYPDTPVSLLGGALSACSFENSDEFETCDRLPSAPGADYDGAAEQSKEVVLASEVMGLVPSSDFEELPESLDDERFATALQHIEDANEDVRVVAARTLGQFRVMRSVRVLTSIVSSEGSARVRAAAVMGLGDLNHESVFAHLLIAFSDPARDVQAAAARSLSRLSVDRSAALVRLLEMEDETVLRDVARACIKTGMVSKAVDKLANPDRRLSYEAFLLLSLIAKSNAKKAI